MLPKHLSFLSIAVNLARCDIGVALCRGSQLRLLLSLSYENVKDQICISPFSLSPPSVSFFLSFFFSSFLLLSYSHLKPNLVDPNFPKLYQTRRFTFRLRDLRLPFFSLPFFFSSLVRIFVSFFQGRGPRSFVFVAEWTNHGTRTYNNLITFPPCRYRDNNYALMARGWNDIMHPLKARKRHCFDASVSH